MLWKDAISESRSKLEGQQPKQKAQAISLALLVHGDKVHGPREARSCLQGIIKRCPETS